MQVTYPSAQLSQILPQINPTSNQRFPTTDNRYGQYPRNTSQSGANRTMSTSSPKQPSTILIVDGEAAVRVSIAYLLEHKGGLQVIEASSADEALLYLSNRSDIQGLITEVQIPGSLNGFALAHAVRDRWPHIAIIITSHQQEPQSGELPDEAVFLQKPYNSEKLINTIKPLIANPRTISM